jgi:hypothetical protein
MATAVHTAPLKNEAQSMTTQQEIPDNNQLRPELEQIVEDIIGLRALAATTGFMTFKSQRDILARLSPGDQAAVGRELANRQNTK